MLPPPPDTLRVALPPPGSDGTPAGGVGELKQLLVGNGEPLPLPGAGKLGADGRLGAEGRPGAESVEGAL